MVKVSGIAQVYKIRRAQVISRNIDSESIFKKSGYQRSTLECSNLKYFYLYLFIK